MKRFVERRPNQVIHGRVLNDKILAARFLRVDNPTQQDSGVADNESPWLQNQFATHRLHGRHDHVGKRIGRQRFLLSIMNAEPAPHVHRVNGMPLLTQSLYQHDRFFQALAIRLRIENGRAQVHVQADNADVAVIDYLLGEFQYAVDIQTEFRAFDAGVSLDMGFGRQGRVDTQGDFRVAIDLTSPIRQGHELRFTFYVEHADIIFQPVAKLAIRLADAGKNNPRPAA